MWRKYHLTYDQTKKVVEQTRHHLGLSAPSERRRTVDRLDRCEVEQLVAAAHRRSSLYGLLVKTLFYMGVRVSELTQVRVEDVYFALDPPQVRFTHAKKGSDRFVPILPSLAQELRTHLVARRAGHLFETNRHDHYAARTVQAAVQQAARDAGLEKHVHPHLLRHSIATLLLDRGMPIDQVQKFLGHRNVTTTQIYAETSTGQMGRSYITALER